MALQRKSRQLPSHRAREYGDLAAAIATRRLELGLSQAELGDLAGVSYRIVHQLESGRTETSLTRVVAVLETLGLHLTVERGAADAVRVGRELSAQWSLAQSAHGPAADAPDPAPPKEAP